MTATTAVKPIVRHVEVDKESTDIYPSFPGDTTTPEQARARQTQYMQAQAVTSMLVIAQRRHGSMNGSISVEHHDLDDQDQYVITFTPEG